MAANYMIDELDKMLSKSMKQINRSVFIKMSVKKTARVQERELYTPLDSYVKCLIMSMGKNSAKAKHPNLNVQRFECTETRSFTNTIKSFSKELNYD